jgi:hypothetical protein
MFLFAASGGRKVYIDIFVLQNGAAWLPEMIFADNLIEMNVMHAGLQSNFGECVCVCARAHVCERVCVDINVRQ